MSLKMMIMLLTAAFLSVVFSSKVKCDRWDFESNVMSDGNGKGKRESTSGLFPFPRVGRAGEKSWKKSFLDQIKRREGLIPFPRVGRSDVQTNNKESPRGVWFGPRLGRAVNGPYFKKAWFLAPYEEYLPPVVAANEREYNEEFQSKNELPYFEEENKEPVESTSVE